MCIALPCRVKAVIDRERMLVAVNCEIGTGEEIVSVALVATPDRPVDQLVGAFVLIHAGFAIALIDDAEARSRLQVFAALTGGESEIALDDFSIATAGVARAPDPPESSGADPVAQSAARGLRHV